MDETNPKEGEGGIPTGRGDTGRPTYRPPDQPVDRPTDRPDDWLTEEVNRERVGVGCGGTHRRCPAGDWANALACYELLLQEKPMDADVNAKLLVRPASGGGDPTETTGAACVPRNLGDRQI